MHHLKSQDEVVRFHKVQQELIQGTETERYFVTKDNRLWFGTNRGLASFDGSEMLYYGSKGLGGINNFRINDLCEDKLENLWIATDRKGLVSFNRKTGWFKEINIAISDKASAKEIIYTTIFNDEKGLIWTGTWDRGFFIYNPATNTYNHFNLNPSKPVEWKDRYNNSVRYIIRDQNDKNIYWLAGYGSGIYKFDFLTHKILHQFVYSSGTGLVWENTKITALHQVNDSIIWFSTWSMGMGEYHTRTGVYKMYPRNSGFKVVGYPNGHIIDKMARRSLNEFYVAPRDTIPAIFNTTSKRFNFLRDDELDREIGRTNNVKTSDQGLVWYFKNGLFLSSPKFQQFNLLDIKSIHPDIKNYYEGISDIIWDDKEKKYYAGVSGSEGVYVLDSNFNRIKILSVPPSPLLKYTASISKLFRDRAGTLWILGDIVCVYDSINSKFLPAKIKWPQLNLQDTVFQNMGEDKNGKLFFSTVSNWLTVFDPFSHQIKKIILPNGKSTAPLNFFNKWVLIDKSRQLLYTVKGQSLFQYNIATESFRELLIDTSFYYDRPPEFNSSHYLDSEGYIWMISPDYNLWKIDPGKFIITDTIKIANSLIDLSGPQFYGTYKEYLLIRTFKGECIFNTKTYECIFLNRKNGLLMDDVWKSSIANNKVFFTYPLIGKTQYASIDKLIAMGNNNKSPYITGVTINNVQLVIDTLLEYVKILKLSYQQNSIGISFSCIEHEFPERLEYSYILQGLDKEWVISNYLNRKIIYAGLSPGKYTFRLKVRMLGNNWSPEIFLSIIIIPPFWQTWWFRVLVFCGVTILLYWLYKRRINLIAKKAVERSQHGNALLELEAKALRTQMNPHFIFNCLNSIKSLIQQKENKKAVTYLTTFSKLIRTLFNNADKKEISLFDEIETCKLYLQLEAIRFDTKFTYAVSVDENIDLKSIQVPALIIQPFIENAIWHGIVPKNNGGNVSLTVSGNNGFIEIAIEDNGIGREASQQNKSGSNLTHQSKGVNLTQARLELDNLLQQRQATLVTIDKKDETGTITGTKVIITIKEEI